MPISVNSPRELNREDTVRLIMDLFHRLIVHHGLWYTEVIHQMGAKKAMEAMKNVAEKGFPIQMNRLSKALGFEMRDGLPAPLLDLPEDTLKGLLEAVAANWLVNDGVWFQSVEFTNGMADAKRCNDTCWGRFSPVEAWSIRNLLELPENCGIEGLKRALNFRLYATINTQSIIDEGPDGIIFQMNECRVQSARKRKGLEDYACKSAGIVEYTYFARAIDPRIQTECVGCPPDEHPEEWYCAWRFKMA